MSDRKPTPDRIVLSAVPGSPDIFRDAEDYELVEGDVVYVRDEVVDALVAAARRETWDKAIELAQAVRPDGSINFVGDWNRARKQFETALEAARQSGKEGE